MLEMLKGKKTYLTALAAMITALAGYLNGTLDLTQLIGAEFVALQSINFRSAMNKPTTD